MVWNAPVKLTEGVEEAWKPTINFPWWIIFVGDALYGYLMTMRASRAAAAVLSKMYKRADIEAQFYPEQNALQLYYYSNFTKQPNSSAHFKHNVVPFQEPTPIDVGGWYVINIWQDTTRVLTNVNNDIYLRDYNEGDQHQIFYATRDAENRLGFVCVGTNKRMGRNRYENVKCEDPPSEQGSWQAFYIEDESDGSRKMSMTIYDNLTPMAYASDSGGQYLTLSSDGNLRFGFTRVGPPS